MSAVLAWKLAAVGCALRHLSKRLIASLSRDSGVLPCWPAIQPAMASEALLIAFSAAVLVS